jgi:hypothetical protein
MRKTYADNSTVPFLTQSFLTMSEYAYSQRTLSAHTKTLSHPMHSQLLFAKRSSVFLVLKS